MKHTKQLIQLKINTESHIALWKITSAKSLNNKNVLLTHGTFSNQKVLGGISDFLIENEFTCWVFEWRNHGASSRVRGKFNFETIGKEDFDIVFQYLFGQCQIKNLDCVTHSGGGICLTIALISKPDYQSRINSITMFACQAFGAGEKLLNYIKILIGKYMGKLLGYLPAQKTGSEENEDYYIMKQWFDWNLRGEFLSEDGSDYREKMKEIKTRVLAVYGKGDTFIAPPRACEIFQASFENPLNESLFCSIENGHLEDYNHGRILHSRNASKEIYPLVLDWITKKESLK